MSNFDFLKNDPQFVSFADVASTAEEAYHRNLASCVMSCHKAMDFAVKWMYSADSDLLMPQQNQLVNLINTNDFKDIVGRDLFQRLDYIRRVGNNANHNSYNVTKDQATLALENLHVFMDFIVYCYGKTYKKTTFNIQLAEQQSEILLTSQDEINFEQLSKANKPFQVEFTDRRKAKNKSYQAKSLNLSKSKIRKTYIDVMLTSLGWERSVGWIDDFPINHMPNKSGFGFADYVLLDDNNNPMAVIEAKKNTGDSGKSQMQNKRHSTESFMDGNSAHNRNCKYTCGVWRDAKKKP